MTQKLATALSTFWLSDDSASIRHVNPPMPVIHKSPFLDVFVSLRIHWESLAVPSTEVNRWDKIFVVFWVGLSRLTGTVQSGKVYIKIKVSMGTEGRTLEWREILGCDWLLICLSKPVRRGITAPAMLQLELQKAKLAGKWECRLPLLLASHQEPVQWIIKSGFCADSENKATFSPCLKSKSHVSWNRQCKRNLGCVTAASFHRSIGCLFAGLFAIPDFFPPEEIHWLWERQ